MTNEPIAKGAAAPFSAAPSREVERAGVAAPVEPVHGLGDFVASPRLIPLALLATAIGVVSAFIALALLRLIGLFTNLFFFQRWDTTLVSPAGNALGIFEVVVPVAGSIAIGLMARYGSEKIRGHGIPEAIEAILINGSRVQPKVAVLKPLSSAISIGSGGPFGAEGPIIMTGGAVGSTIAQFLHMSGAERKTLLVAGAAGGMSATFGTPVAAVLLAVELLLFEWRPRSLIPVALASAAAAAVKPALLGPGPLFPTPFHNPDLGMEALLACVLVGILAGGLSTLLTQAVYAAEDAFGRLPIHWMWWPAIGGLVVGIGGLAFPEALGVGYDVLGSMLQGDVSSQTILGILLVKSTIWAVALGSGTSGGVLAPLLMMGGALGGLEALVLPAEGVGFWPLISMGAILGGTMRSPFTGIVFALELTHDVNSLLPLLIAVPTAYLCTVLTMKRSILTEKISRRGLHLSREYAVDPLETTFVRDVMNTNLVVLPASVTVASLSPSLGDRPHARRQGLYPVLEADDSLAGVVTAQQLDRAVRAAGGAGGAGGSGGSGAGIGMTVAEIVRPDPVVAHPDETLRAIVYRMAETELTRFPVVERNDPNQLVGMISIQDLLHARARSLQEETQRERVLRLRRLWPRREEAPLSAGMA
ncbi:MAG: chloride channel protein [Chloroflexi bacterium]|nr:chloride channel protein [Chloroflexota bacterium]